MYKKWSQSTPLDGASATETGGNGITDLVDRVDTGGTWIRM